MRNEICEVHNENIEKIKGELESSSNLHLVELHGKQIQSWEDYIGKMEDAFKLPTQWPNTIDSYNDWMTDLEWLGRDSYALIIYDYQNFLENDLALKNIVIQDFQELILPWWQGEVEKCVVGGKAKSFNIYLVLTD